MTAEELEKLLAEVTPGEWRVGCGPSGITGPTTVIDDPSVRRGRGQFERICVGMDTVAVAIEPGEGTATIGDDMCPQSTEMQANAILMSMAPALARRVIAAERMAEALRAAIEAGYASKSRIIGGVCGQTVEASLRRTMHDMSAHDLDTLSEALAAYEATK